MIRVYLLSKVGLFGEGLQCLLRQWPGIEIAGCTTRPETAIGQICELKPACVIVENGIPHFSPATIMARVLDGGVRTRVVCLDPDSNLLVGYRERQTLMARMDDLLAAIQGDDMEQTESPGSRTESESEST